MHAVSINEKSLDLIATNNGGLQPAIEPGPNGHPGTYFILPTNPNDHAEIVSIDDFFNNYEFLEPEALDAFRPIRPILQFEKMGPYQIDRDELAHMVACHTSGLHDALPEQADYDIADKMLKMLEDDLSGENGPCPRCGGDHSWCQNVQPGEFGPE
jgi:hypothetical protein